MKKGKGTTQEDNIRTAGELKFEQNQISIKAEYAGGKSGGKNKQTYYGIIRYKFIGNCQAVLRYDWWDPDTNTQSDAQSETTVGLNYFILKNNAKIQLNYGFHNEEGQSVNNDVFRINVQISY